MLRDAKRSAMGKSKNQPLTPRRRALLSQTGAVNKITKSLPRPLSSVAAPACNVKVIVRVRPSNNKESEDNSYTAIKVLDDETLIFDPKEAEDPFFYHGVRQKRRDLLKKVRKDITFTFDRVFSPVSSNMEVFSGSTKNLIDTLMEGCNCSVFAYGATGAGKTYTMIGNIDEPGITYLTMKELFARKEQLSAERDFKLMVTYIEVYNELVKDLLNPGRPLELREDAKYGVMIPDVKGFPINSPEDMFKLLEQGNRRRTQHPTDANAESSRSHAVFQVYIQMTTKASGKSSRAKLSMIDLAGSERGSATGFVGARFKEGANINKSLLALGNCINSLADGHRHVPYRDSKLTRLLKDSLGGNCCTIMIANVSPSSLSYEDTYNTLRYATRAKKIKSTVKRNVVIPDRNVDQCIKVIEDLQNENTNLKREIEQLRAELAEARAGTLQNIPEIVVKAPVEPESTVSLPPQPSPVVAATEPSTDVSASQALRDLVLEKKDLMERVFQLQCSGLGIILRRGQKMTTEARLSVMYVDTPRKDDARRKLHQQLERYERRERCTNLEIEENCRKLRMIDDRIQELLGAHVELKDQWRECSMEIQCIEFKYERDLARREARILKDVCHGHEVLLEDMAKFMAPLFMAVGGVDDAPERLKRQYSNLVATFEGKQSLRWTDDDNIPEVDSGLSSLTSVCEDENTRPSKRKIENGSQVSLNSTFNLPEVTPSFSSGAPSTFGGPSGANIVAKGKKRMVKQASSPRPTYATHTYKTPPRAPTPRKPKPTSLRSATKNKTALEKDRRRWL